MASLFIWLDSLGNGSASFVGSLLAFVFGIIALIFGALFNYWLNRKRDERLRMQEANAISAALYGEIIILRKELARAGNASANIQMDLSPHKKFDRFYLDENPISESNIFEALSGKFGLLPANDVLEIIQFHANIKMVKWWMPQMQKNEERKYTYNILHILHPIRNAIMDIVPTLRAIEARLGIAEPAENPNLDRALQLIDDEEEQLSLYDKQHNTGRSHL